MEEKGHKEDGIIFSGAWPYVRTLSWKKNTKTIVDESIEEGVKKGIEKGCRFDSPQCDSLKYYKGEYKKAVRDSILMCTSGSSSYKE